MHNACRLIFSLRGGGININKNTLLVHRHSSAVGGLVLSPQTTRWTSSSTTISPWQHQPHRFFSSSLPSSPSSSPQPQLSPPQPQQQRPRAAKQSPQEIRSRSAQYTGAAVAALLLLIVAPVGYVMYDQQMDLKDVLGYAKEAVVSAGELDPEDIIAALPPINHYADPPLLSSSAEEEEKETKKNKHGDADDEDDKDEDTTPQTETHNRRIGKPSRAGVIRKPQATLFLGWEGTLVDIVYHPKAGHVAVPRPGVDTFLLACGRANIEVVVWSLTQTSAVTSDQLMGLIKQLVIPRDTGRYREFNHYVDENYATTKVIEASEALAQNRPARQMLPIQDAERPELYAKHLLRLTAVLGKDHCVVRDIAPSTASNGDSDSTSSTSSTPEEGKSTLVSEEAAQNKLSKTSDSNRSTSRRRWNLLATRRDPSSVFLIADTQQPDIQLKSFSSNTAIATQTTTSLRTLPIGKWRADAGGAFREDPTLPLIAAFLDDFQGWRQQQQQQQKQPNQPVVDVSIRAYIEETIQRGAKAGMRPSTGAAIDDTVAILGTVLADVKKSGRG